MDKGKKIIIFMIVIVICIIVIIVALLMISKKEKLKEDNPLTLAFEDIEELQNKALFYQMNEQINQYFDYIEANNMQAVRSIMKEGKIELKRAYNTINFESQKIYVLDKVNNVTAYVYGAIRKDGIQDEYYLILNLDYSNNTYGIVMTSKEEYDNATNNQIDAKYKENIYIEKNDYNAINQLKITDFNILNILFEDYKFKALYKPEEAFELIDAEYKKKKFNNDIAQYKAYIQNNINRFQDANIVKHSVTRNGQFGEYIAIDSYNNYYMIKETGINEYTIILDNYTLLDKETTDKYNAMSDKDKVTSNIDKVMKLVNEKDYEQIYNYLNVNFKNNYFKTLDSFTTYLSQNFFDNNIVGALSLKLEGQSYIVTIPYKESLSRVAEEREIAMIIQLKEGTKFELAFVMK